jgi:hypothetical protein
MPIEWRTRKARVQGRAASDGDSLDGVGRRKACQLIRSSKTAGGNASAVEYRGSSRCIAPPDPERLWCRMMEGQTHYFDYQAILQLMQGMDSTKQWHHLLPQCQLECEHAVERRKVLELGDIQAGEIRETDGKSCGVVGSEQKCGPHTPHPSVDSTHGRRLRVF